ncbi:MAG: hypothetical protein ACREJD_04415 [Phycisphaerales bacterium]
MHSVRFTAVAISGLIASSASAAISLVSRASTAQETYNAGIPEGQPGASSYNHVNSFTNFGNNSLSLPSNGTVLTSNVTTSLISATLKGRSQAGPPVNFSNPYSTLSTQLVVRLTVTNGYADLTLLLNGSATPARFSSSADPSGENAYFAVLNDATNAVIFDSFSRGTISSGGARYVHEWKNATWSGTLGPGSYRILTGADGDLGEHIGPGAGDGGDGNMTSRLDMVFRVPTPGGMAFASIAALFAARRRR